MFASTMIESPPARSALSESARSAELSESELSESELSGRRGAARPEPRVPLLLAGIAILGLTDLALTLVHLAGTGMFEGNPIVLALVRWTGSAVALACYKSLTMVIGAHLLLRARHRASAQLGAWFVFVVFAVVVGRWACYVDALAELPASEIQAMASSDAEWVALR